MAANKNPKFGLCIDWETSGSTWGGDSSIDYQGLSIGVIVFNFKTLEPVDALYLEIKFDDSKYKWSTDAEKIHGLSRKHLEENGITQEEAAISFAEMFLKYFDVDEEIFVLGHNVLFDIKFTEQLLSPFGLMFKVSHRMLDTVSIGWGAFGIIKSDDLFELLGLGDRSEHNALQDAMMTLEAAKRIRELMNANLGI